MTEYTVSMARHNGTEDESFNLSRPSGTNDYLFIHFKTNTVFTLFDKMYYLTNGNCILLSPGTPHFFYPDNCRLVHDWVHFLPSNEGEFIKSAPPLNTFFSPHDPGFITSVVKKCELELIYREQDYESMVSSEMNRLFITLKRRISKPVSGSNPELKTLRLDIYNNPHLYPDTTVMAKSVSLSRSRFSVVYKDHFGVSPKTDLIAARISKATYLLSLGTLTLNEIFELCGYQSVYHFIRQFRQETGTTPGKFRKNL